MADRRLIRWRGMRPMSLGWGLVIAGDRVHTRGMAVPLAVVGLDGDSCVVERRVVAPGRFVRLGHAVCVVELPEAWPLPPIGVTLSWRPILGKWPVV